MFRKMIQRVGYALAVTLAAPLCHAAVGPITSVTTDNPDGTIPYNLLTLTVGDVTLSVEQLGVGTTTVGLTTDGEPWPEMDNFDIHDAIDTGLGTTATTVQFGGKNWIDTNGDRPDFFIFESHSGNSSGDNPQVAPMLPGGVTGQPITLPGSQFGPTGSLASAAYTLSIQTVPLESITWTSTARISPLDSRILPFISRSTLAASLGMTRTAPQWPLCCSPCFK